MIDIAFFKEQLEADLVVITKELSTLGVKNPQNPQDWIATPEPMDAEADSDLIADRNEDSDERQAILAALETQYNDSTRALSKIEQGTYGTCEVCGDEIEEARLNANPSARTCIVHMDEEQDLPS